MEAKTDTKCLEAGDMEVKPQDEQTVAQVAEPEQTGAAEPEMVPEGLTDGPSQEEEDQKPSAAEAEDFQAEIEESAEERGSLEAAEHSEAVAETADASTSEQSLSARTSFLLAAAKTSLEVTDSALETCPEDFVSAPSESDDEDGGEEAGHHQFQSVGDCPEEKTEEATDQQFKSASEDLDEDIVDGTHEHFKSVGDSLELEHPESDQKGSVLTRSDEQDAEVAKLGVEDNLDDAACSETTDATAGDAQADTDASHSDSDNGVPASAVSSQEGQDSVSAQPEVRVLHVQATLPQDIHFVVPSGCVPGQLLAVQGPHGPLHVQAPQGVKAGQRCTVRLAPPFQHEVLVPAGAVAGQKVTFLGENDEELEAIVPPGLKAGQVFHVSPPVVMVPVPTGIMKGDMLCFTTPKGQALMAPVPDGLTPGQYFPVQY